MGVLGTVGAIGERALQSQLQETTMNVTGPTESHSAAPSLVLLIGLPLLLVILTAIIVLLLVLAGQSLRHRLQNSGKHQYRSVPTEDTDCEQRPLSLPYPPTVKLEDPPTPSMTFHMATQLSDPATTGSRYPFLQHQQTKRSVYETRPRRLRTRRRGNDKHWKGMHLILNGAEPDPEVLKERLEESKIKKQMEKVVHESTPTPPRLSPCLWLQEYKPHMYHYQVPPEKKSSKVQEEPSKDPEIFLTLLYNKDTASLVVRVDRVVGLPFRGDGSEVDAYVRLFFIPKVPELPQRRTSKTKPVGRHSSPVFDEEICYEAMSAEELINSTLHIEVLDYRSYGKHSILGQVGLPLARVKFEKGEATVTLSLHPPKVRENLGTVLLSLCYTPKSKKLSIIILRAKDLNKGNARDTDCQAKISVMVGDKVVGKIKTKRRSQSCSPIFNEALTVCVDPERAHNMIITVNMLNESKQAERRELGKVSLCAQASGEEYRHWNDIMASPGKHIAEWHELR